MTADLTVGVKMEGWADSTGREDWSRIWRTVRPEPDGFKTEHDGYVYMNVTWKNRWYCGKKTLATWSTHKLVNGGSDQNSFWREHGGYICSSGLTVGDQLAVDDSVNARPAWVLSGGSVDVSLMPDQVPVADLEGNQLLKCDGEPVTMAKVPSKDFEKNTPKVAIVVMAEGDDPVYVPSLDPRIKRRACNAGPWTGSD